MNAMINCVQYHINNNSDKLIVRSKYINKSEQKEEELPDFDMPELEQ